MKNNDLNTEVIEEPRYTVAEGLDGLASVLEDFLAKSKEDKLFATKGHFILYRFGSQNSLIKVDMSKEPFMFYYSDLLGRPITQGIKRTIVKFLWEKCGLKHRYTEPLEYE